MANASDTFPYPQGSVVGVLTDEAALTAARERLDRSGLGDRSGTIMIEDLGVTA